MKPFSVKIRGPMLPCDKKTKDHLKSTLYLTYDGPLLGKYVYMLPGGLYIFLPTRTALNELKKADWAVATLDDGSAKLIGIAPDISCAASRRFHHSYDDYSIFSGKDFIFAYQNGVLYVAQGTTYCASIRWLTLISYEEANK